MTNPRPVIVKQLPEVLNLSEVQVFLRAVETVLKVDRVQMIFDLSQVRQLDGAGAEMLLHCLEEVMKRDGDLKLAAIPPAAAVILELTRVDRLFEVFESVGAAVESFYGYEEAEASTPWYSSLAMQMRREVSDLGIAG